MTICHYLTKCLILRKSSFKYQTKIACANSPSNTYDTSISTIYRKGKSLQPNVWKEKFGRHQRNSTSYVDTSSPVKSNLFGESLKNWTETRSVPIAFESLLARRTSWRRRYHHREYETRTDRLNLTVWKNISSDVSCELSLFLAAGTGSHLGYRSRKSLKMSQICEPQTLPPVVGTVNSLVRINKV